jgi:hypothetical protein
MISSSLLMLQFAVVLKNGMAGKWALSCAYFKILTGLDVNCVSYL